MINAVNNNITYTAAAGINAAAGADFSKVLDESLSGTNKTSLDDIFERAAERYSLPVDLLKAVAKAESSFNPNAVSRCGAEGIMQLMPATARALGVADSFDAEQNIMGGAKYLSQMLAKFDGDVSLALAAYNAGPDNVVKYSGIPPFNETQNYVKNVLSYMDGGLSTAGKYYTRSASSAVSSGGLDSGLSTMILMRLFEMMTQKSDDEDKKIF